MAKNWYAFETGDSVFGLSSPGGPATVYRFATAYDRDTWVNRRWSVRRALQRNHLWVKQAHWRAKLEGAQGWDEMWILMVSYDMTTAHP